VATNLEKGRISGKQLMFIVFCYIQGGALLSGSIVNITKQDTWVVIVTGFTVALFIAWIMVQLAKSFPDKTLIEINELVFGKIGGNIISLLYVLYFFLLTTLDIDNLTSFITGFVMPNTPDTAIALVFTFVCGYAIYKGINVIGRCSFLVVLLTIVTILFNSFLLIKDMNFNNFLPMFSLPFMDYVHGTHLTAVAPFGGSICFLMIFPFVKEKKHMAKYFYLGGAIGFLLFLFIVVRDWAVLGTVATYMAGVTYQVVGLVDVSDLFTRLEVLYSIILVLGLFYTATIEFYSLTLSIAQVFKAKTYKPYIFIIGIILICLSNIIFSSVSEHSYFTANIDPAFLGFFAALLPAITLVIASVRGAKKKQGSEIV